MTPTLLVAGTASHVGKSTVVTGLCRLLAARGVAVAPFKAQNMSNNARVVVRATASSSESTDDYWGEIGVSQFVQARGATVTPTTDMNPVLLKPRGDGESQLLLDGVAVGHVEAGSYYDDHWERARATAERAYRRLAREYDVVIAEGAGSIAEINLHHRDLANVETARFADAQILLLVDIERGGAFASLYGTLALLPADLRERVVGAVITKFRGDPSLLEDGIDEIESLTGVPILGALPYHDPGLPEEDSVSLPAPTTYAVRGRDSIPDEQSITIAVPRLPRLSNATDLETLTAEPGVRVAYLPVEGEQARTDTLERALSDADAVVIPGTKNTVDDLLAIREAGFDDAIAQFDGPIVGLCGGFQLLGTSLHNVSLEGTDVESSAEMPTGGSLAGLGLLPVETAFEREKHLEQTTVPVDGDATPLLAGADGTATGYEIHAGRTRVHDGATDSSIPNTTTYSKTTRLTRPLGPSSVACGLVLGTYLHGLFDNQQVREAFLACVRRQAGVSESGQIDAGVGDFDSDGSSANSDVEHSAYDRVATHLERHVDLEALSLPVGSE